jgi:hypothetical protein
LTDPHWYKDAIIYQLHVKAFYDANEDSADQAEKAGPSWAEGQNVSPRAARRLVFAKTS